MCTRDCLARNQQIMNTLRDKAAKRNFIGLYTLAVLPQIALRVYVNVKRCRSYAVGKMRAGKQVVLRQRVFAYNLHRLPHAHYRCGGDNVQIAEILIIFL